MSKYRWRSRNKPVLKDSGLETVDESRVLVADLRPFDHFKDNKSLTELASISIQKDVLKPSLTPITVEEATKKTLNKPEGWRGKLQGYLISLRFQALVTILVLLDVFLVLLDLIITGDILTSECSQDSQCNRSICSESCIAANVCLMNNASLGNQNATKLRCTLVGFKRECRETGDSSVPIVLILNGVSLFILFVFIVEIIIKIIAFRFQFFKKFFEVFDAVIVITSFIMEFVKFAYTIDQIITPNTDNDHSIEKLQFFDLLIAFRLWRVVRIITGALASYNTAKTQHHKTEMQKVMLGAGKRYQELYDEYKYACNEVLRLRQSVLKLKGNPFPPGYQLTLVEAQDIGIHPEAYNLVERRSSQGRESTA